MEANAAHTSTTLGALIRQARERAGLSLRNLEAITGIPRTILNRLELDQLDASSPHLLQRTAEALELDSDDLFALAGYRPSDKLPSLAPYLRAKYHLPPHALAEASEALQAILERYDRTHERERPSGP
jgi:transcriptional regulator with XRE-family HTH domain